MDSNILASMQIVWYPTKTLGQTTEIVQFWFMISWGTTILDENTTWIMSS